MALPHRVTRFSDVCGGTDECKRLLTEESTTSVTPDGRAVLSALLDDGMYMLARMEERLREYEAYRDAVRDAVAALDAVGAPDMPQALAQAERARHVLTTAPDLEPSGLIDLLEDIRQVANDMEGALRRHKDGAVGLARAYGALRGSRGWPDELGSGAGATLGETSSWIPQAWLPPSPHREHIIESLIRGRASLLTETELETYPVGPQGREPIVQFEDGGVMPLRVVRWDDAVENFYPNGQTPHPRGLRYRDRNAGPDAPPE